MRDNKTLADRKKVQFEFNGATLTAINQMVKDSGCITKNELIRNALSVYRWVLDQQMEGRKVTSITDNGYGTIRELVDIAGFLRNQNGMEDKEVNNQSK